MSTEPKKDVKAKKKVTEEKTVTINRDELLKVKLFLDDINAMMASYVKETVTRQYAEAYAIVYRNLNG